MEALIFVVLCYVAWRIEEIHSDVKRMKEKLIK